MTRPGPGRPVYQLPIALLGWGVLVIATAVIGVGWGLNVVAVRSVIPGAVGMKFLTAVGLSAGAIGLLLRADQRREDRHKLGLAFAAVPGLLGVAVLCEYLFHIKLGIDEFPFADHGGKAAHIAFPGRFAPTTGLCFLLLTGALLALDRGTKWRWRPSELMAIPIAITAFFSLIGYAYSIPAFYGPASAAKMAVNTAVCFVALGLALLLSRPRGRVLELATTADPGGVMIRRTVPLCLVVPLVLGWLHLRTIGWGLFNLQVGTWWLAAATVAVLVGMMWWCAGTLSQTDRARRALEKRLVELANRDPLTGLFNRHRFEEELDQLLARSRRTGESGSLLLFDLDRLKPVNDAFGHAIGDRMLRAVADVVTGRLRATDAVGRLGGDEFAVLLLGASPLDAVTIANALLAAIAEIEIETDRGSGWTSASIGVTSIDAVLGTDSSEYFGRADAAMYQAKRAGGNQVVSSERPSVLSSVSSG